MNLKEIRTFNHCSQQRLAELLNVSRSTVAMWETHQSEPSIEILNSISKIFNISLDYLLGESVDSEGIAIARKRVKLLLDENDFSFDDIEAAFGTNILTLKAWCDGYGDFFNNKLDTLANFFGVSVDYLLGREEKSSVPPAVTTEDEELIDYLEELRSRPEMRMLFSLSKNATKEDVEDAVRIIEALRKGRQS